MNDSSVLVLGSFSNREQARTPSFRMLHLVDTSGNTSQMSAEHDRDVLSRPQDIAVKKYKMS